MMQERGGDAAVDAGGPPESIFQQAVALRRAGDLIRAERLCAGLLEADPRHFHAHHLRGLLALDRGDLAEGVASLCRSLAINPNQAMVYSNLGNALLSLGQPDRALASLEEALRLKPDLGAAHYNRGNALKDLGRLEAALASYEAALDISGGDARALNNKGVVLRDLGHASRALSAFTEALAIDPRFSACRANLSAMLLEVGRSPEALALNERALESNADDADALCGRAAALLALRRFEAALEDFERVLQSRPESTMALGKAGNISLTLDRAEAALAYFDRALAVSPQDPTALYGRGATLLKMDRVEAAAQAFSAVLRAVPEHGPALESLFHLRMKQCDWRDHERLSTGLREALRRTRRFVNPLSLLSFDEPEINQACARTYVNEVVGPGAVAATRRPARRAKIRIAYVSADFCDHPVSRCLAGVLERHDRRRFDVIGVSLRPSGGGAFEQRVRSAFDRDIDASALSDSDAAQAMRDAGVDIAVDLMGFTEGARMGMFAHRPAPAQVSYLGYAATTGAPYMDYILADDVVIPVGMDIYYDECVVKLPHCFLPTDDRRPVGVTPTRQAVGLPARAFVFCAFSKAHKITPAMFGIWLRLMREVPDSVLWLSDMGAPARDNLGHAAEGAGIRRDRLVFAPRVADNTAHLARLALADLFLDTLPYNAHSTTCDVLWAGVPVLTCAGRAFAARVASSALKAAGLPELIAADLAEYERRALELARQPGHLAALRSRLLQSGRSSPLFDTGRYTQDLEAAFVGMQERAPLTGMPRP
jgi:predicted O-linked N-acetylglucosamine transferase (SPINDLY family)